MMAVYMVNMCGDCQVYLNWMKNATSSLSFPFCENLLIALHNKKMKNVCHSKMKKRKQKNVWHFSFIVFKTKDWISIRLIFEFHWKLINVQRFSSLHFFARINAEMKKNCGKRRIFESKRSMKILFTFEICTFGNIPFGTPEEKIKWMPFTERPTWPDDMTVVKGRTMVVYRVGKVDWL